MEIRRFDGRDEVREIIRIDALAWREAYDEILPADALDARPVEPTREDVDRWLEGGLAANRDGVLVAVSDSGQVRGFADLRWGDDQTKEFVGDNEAGLKAIYVHPDHWGKGIGTALLEGGLDILPDWVEALRLEVFAENSTGRSFYEARGFEQTGSGHFEIAGDQYPTAIYTLGV